MRFGLGDVLVTLGWAIAVASISVQALYVRPILTQHEIVLLFVVSVVAGMILVDLEILVSSFFVAFGLAFSLAYFCLVLPSLLGIAGPAGEVLYSGAVVLIFRAVFPAPFFVILIGGFFGSFLGERLKLR